MGPGFVTTRLQPSRMPEATRAGLPAYEERLHARHVVFHDAFERMINALPVPEGGRVLDIGCGDGYFIERFLLSPNRPSVVGLDNSTTYLAHARRTKALQRADLLCGRGEKLPCTPGAFDLVWSGHSMQSYDDAQATIAEAYTALKPGGAIAILENDRLHARVLPLAPELEIALLEKNVAELATRPAGKAFQARWCEQLLEAVGFQDMKRISFLLERQSPWNDAAQRFYELLLAETLENARERLTGPLLAAAERTLDPASPTYLGERRFRFFCELHTLFVARKPTYAAPRTH